MKPNSKSGHTRDHGNGGFAGWLSLSPSAVTCYEACPRQYYFKYIQGWRKLKMGVNLVFGTTVHAAFEAVLRTQLDGRPRDHLKSFQDAYDLKLRNPGYEVDWGKEWDVDSLEATGQSLSRQLPDIWQSTGLAPLMTASGDAMIEYSLETALEPGVKLNAILDVACLNEDGETVIPDFKTAASESTPYLAYNSDQLAMQQEVFTQNAEKLGLSSPDKVGFMEAIKVKVPVPKLKKDGTPSKQKLGKGPLVHAPNLVPAYSEVEMQDFRQKWAGIAGDIHDGRFPKRALAGFNSPCKMCDFAELCTKNDSTGLVQKRPYVQSGPQEPMPSAKRFARGAETKAAPALDQLVLSL